MKNIKFEDIKTREEVLTRIVKDGDFNRLSTGNKWWMIKDLFTMNEEEGKIKVIVKYTAGAGGHSIVRYI